MKLKYYLRGLGVGVVVTAVIMTISGRGKTQTMTDAQIIARAKELGMVEAALAEDAEEDGNEEETVEIGADEKEGAGAQEEGAVTAAAAANAPAEEPAADAEPEESDAETDDGEGAGGEQPVDEDARVETIDMVAVAVYPGEGSHTVSRKLANLGLVESADIFDDFLCQNGYDKKLCTGNYEIPRGADAHEIAKILTQGQ